MKGVLRGSGASDIATNRLCSLDQGAGSLGSTCLPLGERSVFSTLESAPQILPGRLAVL